MFEALYILAQRYNREAPASQGPTADISEVSGWVGLQGFLAGLAFNIVGLAAVAFFSSDENRIRRVGWAAVGALTALGLILLAI